MRPLPWILPRYRDLWRFRAPLSAGEIRRTERWLATARVALIVTAEVTLWLEPANGFAYSRWLYWLLTVYLAHAVVVMILVRFHPQSTRAFRLVVHSADVVWPVLISMFAPAQRGPFFLFFVFVMAAAAYRWGLWETVGTAVAAVAMLWSEPLATRLGLVSFFDQSVRAMNGSGLGLNARQLDPQQLFMSSFYLIVLGFLLGYMAENQKKARAERAVITRILSATRVEHGLSGNMEQILRELTGIFGASRSLAASRERNSYRVFLAEVFKDRIAPQTLRWREASAENQNAYLFDSPADVTYTVRKGTGFQTVMLDHAGMRLRSANTEFVEELARVEKFDTMLSVALTLGAEWSGRVYLFDARQVGNPEEELRFLQDFAQQVGPAIYNVYLVRRLRERAGALERARFARELHDGAIQSLIAVEMQLDVIRRQSGPQSPVVKVELGRIQKLLREEVLKLRELMQTMKSFEVDAERLLGFISDTVERFRRETGIAAEFVSEVERVELAQKGCRELARIVQESLVNVRKHSGAHHVLVRLAQKNGSLQLTVEDDGKGFDFTGRRSGAELATTRTGPAIIQERVHLLAGDLAIESTPGHGARLEVRIPPTRRNEHA